MDLENVLDAFAMDERPVNADLLDEYVRLYPEHASALTELAIDLAVDALRGDDSLREAVSPKDINKVTPSVSRAISHFQNLLHAAKGAAPSADRVRASSVTGTPANPFVSLDRGQFRSLAQELHANNAFVCKLRDRQVSVTTMTSGFLAKLSKLMKVSVDALVAHFSAPATVQATRQHFKADGKPSATTQQTFAEAVESSGLSEEQRKYLTSL